MLETSGQARFDEAPAAHRLGQLRHERGGRTVRTRQPELLERQEDTRGDGENRGQAEKRGSDEQETRQVASGKGSGTSSSSAKRRVSAKVSWQTGQSARCSSIRAASAPVSRRSAWAAICPGSGCWPSPGTGSDPFHGSPSGRAAVSCPCDGRAGAGSEVWTSSCWPKAASQSRFERSSQRPRGRCPPPPARPAGTSGSIPLDTTTSGSSQRPARPRPPSAPTRRAGTRKGDPARAGATAPDGSPAKVRAARAWHSARSTDQGAAVEPDGARGHRRLCSIQASSATTSGSAPSSTDTRIADHQVRS